MLITALEERSSVIDGGDTDSISGFVDGHSGNVRRAELVKFRIDDFLAVDIDFQPIEKWQSGFVASGGRRLDDSFGFRRCVSFLPFRRMRRLTAILAFFAGSCFRCREMTEVFRIKGNLFAINGEGHAWAQTAI